MKRRHLPPTPSNRSRLVLWGAAASLMSGGYLLFPNSINNTLGRHILVPISHYASRIFVPPLNRMKRSFVYLGEFWEEWSPSPSNDFGIRWEDGSFFTVIWEGNKKLLVTTKNIILEMSKFIFVHLPNHINKHGFIKSVEYLRHYLRPLKMLFTRPELERIQSSKTRFDQFVNAFRNPLFPSTLSSMNVFYLKFKDQISQLSDEQLAELIDIYLEDPVALKKKVDLIMEKMGEDEELIRKNFDVDLMMDFIRGENIDRIKARIAASKVSSQLNKFTSLFVEDSSEYDKSNLTEDKRLDESIERLFVSTVT